ncbi:MAG: sensor histidine kinase [Planctomycetota bacterium]
MRVAGRIFVITMAILFVCEAAVMVILHVSGLRGPADIVLDPILLSVLGVVPLYCMLLRPLRKALERQQRTERSLREQNQQIREMSEALQRSQRELAQREKMAAVGTLAAGVAHEVGNPLACLSATVQLLNRGVLSQRDRSHLANLQAQIGRITEVIRELAQFAEPSRTEPALVDLDDLVEHTVHMVRYSRRSRGVRIECRLGNGDCPGIRIPPQQFQLVLVNLLLNAFAANGVVGEHVVTVERTVEENRVLVKVTDRGVGMAEQDARRAFEPFYTANPFGRRAGLGLAVSYSTIEELGGRISIDSSPGRGTVATVSLPLVEA